MAVLAWNLFHGGSMNCPTARKNKQMDTAVPNGSVFFSRDLGMGQNPRYPCSSHQNSWDLWMFIPLKMVLIGIDPYPPAPKERKSTDHHDGHQEDEFPGVEPREPCWNHRNLMDAIRNCGRYLGPGNMCSAMARGFLIWDAANGLTFPKCRSHYCRFFQ